MEELIKELQAQNKTLCLIEATDGVEVSRIFQTLKDKDKILFHKEKVIKWKS